MGSGSGRFRIRVMVMVRLGKLVRWITESVQSEASEMLACDVGALFLHSTDGACPMAVALPKYAALKASRSWSSVSCWATKTFCSLSMTPPRYQHAFHFMCPAGFSWSTSKSRAKDQHSPSDSRVYLQAGWGADPQPWEGHRRAGGWLRRGCGRWPGRGGTPWPIWLWQGWPCGAAASDGGRRINRLACTARPGRRGSAAQSTRIAA